MEPTVTLDVVLYPNRATALALAVDPLLVRGLLQAQTIFFRLGARADGGMPPDLAFHGLLAPSTTLVIA